MMRLFLLLAACLALSPLHADEDGFSSLLNKDLRGWKVVPESAADTFSIKEADGEPVLFVTGKPLAYLHTEKTYKDFSLRYQWIAPKEGQSGLLLHIGGPHKVWPRCIQAQARAGDHGRLFPMGGAVGRFSNNPAAQLKAVKEGDWNTTEVVSREGRLTVTINGTEVSSGTTELKEGYIGFQSEGTPFQFKNIRLKKEPRTK